jgi:integrase
MSRRRGYQEGSLIKRGKRTKVWVARWWEEVYGADNKLQRIRRSQVLGLVSEISTVREARQMLSDLLRKVNSGDYRPQSAWTFGRFVEERWKPDTFPTLKFSSKQFYNNMLNAHLIPTFGDTQLRLITRASVQSFISAKTQSDLSWKTVKLIRTAFGTIIEAAVMQDLLTDNPVRKTKLPRRGPIVEKTPIEPERLKKLIQALPQPSHSIALLLASTGMRIGELLALRWRDVDLKAGKVQIRQTVYEGVLDDPKTKRSRRTIPLGKQGIAILARYSASGADPEALVFATGKGTPLSRRNLLNRQFKPTCERLGLRGVSWHWLRHATATLSNSAGTPLGTIQELLGHSSSQLTREVYLEAVPSDMKNAVQNVEDLLIGPKWTQVLEWPEMGSTLIN